MRFTVLAFACFLVACAPRSAEEAPTEAPSGSGTALAPSASAPASTLTPVETLAGEWRVAGIDGKDFDEPYGLALSANGEELWWAPRCAGMARGYRIDGLGVRFSPPANGRRESSDEPAPVCAIGLPPRLADVMRALDAATTVGRTPGNGIEISGGDHSVLLFSQ